ncbi:hypothetical protein Trydic_g10431 [Trypoxylus dichotomus]
MYKAWCPVPVHLRQAKLSISPTHPLRSTPSANDVHFGQPDCEIIYLGCYDCAKHLSTHHHQPVQATSHYRSSKGEVVKQIAWGSEISHLSIGSGHSASGTPAKRRLPKGDELPTTTSGSEMEASGPREQG